MSHQLNYGTTLQPPHSASLRHRLDRSERVKHLSLLPSTCGVVCSSSIAVSRMPHDWNIWWFPIGHGSIRNVAREIGRVRREWWKIPRGRCCCRICMVLVLQPAKGQTLRWILRLGDNPEGTDIAAWWRVFMLEHAFARQVDSPGFCSTAQLFVFGAATRLEAFFAPPFRI